MAKTKISEFDSNPANNTDIDSINIAEGCAPSGINNAIRELMSQLKDQQTGASGDNFTVGGNLVVTGTTVHTGATTFTGAVVMSTALPVASGGTGASTAGNARTNLSAAASGANSDITSITGLTTPLTVAQGGIGAATLTANSVLLGNGTSTPQLIAPSTNGNFLRSNGTTWTSQAVTIGTGTVTSVATGNGLSGGTITTSGTLVLACPTENTVGSYCVVLMTMGNGASNTFGGNYSTGNGNTQVSLSLISGNPRNPSGTISGTWKWLGVGGIYDCGGTPQAIACRVA
jgi:hypothetical protein